MPTDPRRPCPQSSRVPTSLELLPTCPPILSATSTTSPSHPQPSIRPPPPPSSPNPDLAPRLPAAPVQLQAPRPVMQSPDAALATTAHPPASTSSGDPSPTPSTSKHPFEPAAPGPSHPSSFLPNQARHSRRPSRAERYEAIVASAREVLARGTRRSSVEGVGLGLSSPGPTAREGKRRSRLEEVAAEAVGRNEWEDTVRSLLRVVDGMVRLLVLSLPHVARAFD